MTELTDFERILVPIDFSDGSRGALDHAAALARTGKGEILLLHVVEPVVMPTLFAEQSMATMDMAGWSDNAERNIRKLADEYREKGLRVRTMVHPGYASHDILDTASQEGADLIVIGSSGHRAATYALFGSTVERVVRNAHCPVLVTRPENRTSANPRR